MESIEQNENAPRKRIKPKAVQASPQDEEKEESQENSTENTRKKILPNRINRGQRMKALQGKELEQHDELYDLIFGERSSDEDFAPSQSDISDDESFGGKAEKQADEPEEEKGELSEDETPKNKPKKRIRLSNKNNENAGKPYSKNKNEEEEIVDLDMIDLDKIDELEDMRDKGMYPEDEEVIDEDISDDEEPTTKKRKQKTKSKLNKNIKNKKQISTENPDTRKTTSKAFIDYSDDEEFVRKRNRSKINIRKPIKKQKTESNLNLREKNNRNVTFRNNFEVMIINKAIFRENEEEQINEMENINQEDGYLEDEENQEKNLEEENKNTRNIIKKFKKQEKVEALPSKYTFFNEKLSQKELLLEAIFTEYYNNQSLIEMQRLEDLNKKEMSVPGKRQLTEYVKIVNRHIQEPNEAIQKEKKEEDKLLDIPHENFVYFTNPLVYNKIFENFNRCPPTQKTQSVCAITGQPAKYFDPLTKQPYKDKEAFKILRERYFQKEEDSLLFRIQTLSDLASQKKEKLKKIILSEGSGKDNANASKNIINIMNKYGILKNEGVDLDKKVSSHRIYNRNRENCVDSGMLVESNKKILIISKKIFKDKYSNRGLKEVDDERI